MRHKIILWITLFSITPLNGLTQWTSGTDTVFNQTDQNGMRQGFWKKFHENGTVKFEGFFENDKPLGVFKRYYDNKAIQSIMVFKDDGKTASARIFYNNGNLGGEGMYINQLKDGEWRYYSYYDTTLTYIENYVLGQKHGVSIKYYSDGQLSEELGFSYGKKEGDWIQYFPDGTVYLKSAYKNGLLEGPYTVYFESGTINIKGNYLHDKKQGEWIIYDEKGTTIVTFSFNNGIALNQSELNKEQHELLEQLEKNKGKFRDPRISDVRF
ncbi:MAG: toxin-antitoxin system YwqK family antitoxin [Bacteroidales bacterium]|nr:MAG: toxin-antitoxin system YwqK family antitoxin [Bacteroidales bacterium]